MKIKRSKCIGPKGQHLYLKDMFYLHHWTHIFIYQSFSNCKQMEHSTLITDFWRGSSCLGLSNTDVLTPLRTFLIYCWITIYLSQLPLIFKTFTTTNTIAVLVHLSNLCYALVAGLHFASLLELFWHSSSFSLLSLLCIKEGVSVFLCKVTRTLKSITLF